MKLKTSCFGSRFGGVVWMVRAGTVRIHLYYFPGWEVLVDGKPALYRVAAPYGLIETDLPVGEHRIDVRMGWTPVRLVGAAVDAGMTTTTRRRSTMAHRGANGSR